ncbi:synaptopodin 2-like protein [Genypterus blacodes]|uniref:synaptopodin 2-like protein n=1 Tax=Genypterus blacodes TaxID=154954 RepID=UPI003F774B74
MVAEEVIITLSGGAPWGFRLQGGAEHEKPLQVAKIRKRSKACRAGLREADELVSINEQPCAGLSHGQAMELIDSSTGILHIQVKRAPAGFQSVVLVTRAPSPRIDKEYCAALRTLSPSNPQHAPVREIHRSQSSLTSGLTSPPGSEAYYGETDSDADVAGYERQRRQKRRSPSNSTPGKPSGRASPEGGETSEMSGYDSAPDAQVYPDLLDGRAGGDEGGGLPGVARREVVYQPPVPGLWSSQTSTETSSIISSADDQGPRDGAQEEDSGFLEPSNVPLVSPERAKEALMLSSRDQLVPMVGPLSKPIDEELTTTYVEKAKQAKLNRGDTLQDKHVKEAKNKCRTIASLLTDAPNPHSKGVLMFKKRRQRSKKYTLTSFGSVDEDTCQDSQEEEDGVFPGSESEIDEEGFSSVPDPTWDSDYLDMLEKRATAGSEGRGDGLEDAPSPGLSNTTGKGAQLFEQQRKRAAEHAKKVEAAHPQPPFQSQAMEYPQIYQGHSEIQPNLQPQQLMPPVPTALQQETQPLAFQGPVTVGFQDMSHGDLSYSAVSTASMVMSPPAVPSKHVSVVSQPEAVAQTPAPGPGNRTGILHDARRRGGRPKPMFIVPEAKKYSPNPALLSMVQNLDDRSARYGQSTAEVYYEGAEEEKCGEAGRMPPPVAPKPRLIHEGPQILQAEGKGAQLFARRQNRMGMYVVDTPPETPYQQEINYQQQYSPQFFDSQNPSLPPQFKYSPNVRAPPPIGYNPLLAPTIPTGPQRDTSKIDSRGMGGSQKEGIKTLDFMRRQPYQLNSAMFNYGGSAANQSGISLTSPKQIPIKTARVIEVKRFSTPTPMSAPTLTPKVIAPRSATSLGEPPAPTIAPAFTSPHPAPCAMPNLPKFSSATVPNPVPTAIHTPYTPASYTTGLQAAKQFQSAPELRVFAFLPPKHNPVQVPKPRFVATKGGVQPGVWRPGGQFERY